MADQIADQKVSDTPRFREDREVVPIQPWEEAFGWRVEQAFWSYFNRSEDPEGWNRRWIVEKDVPWEAIKNEPLSEDAATMIESFFAVESYLPDFAEKGLGYYRSMVGLSNSHINWSYEELKHGRTLQLILERSGARTQDETREFRLGLARNAWTMPYPTARQMLIYASFQEKETQRNYELLRGVLAGGGSFGAGQGLRIIGRDEAFHHAFYKDMVKILLEYDEVGTAQDIQKVANSFRMPAQHLMPNMENRVRVMVKNKVFGKKQVRDEAIIPTIKAFGFRDPEELASVASARPNANSEERLVLAPGPDFEDETVTLLDADGAPLSTRDVNGTNGSH
ncbi:MAG: acyl-ACP desaturase [Chloroflexota bacterium]